LPAQARSRGQPLPRLEAEWELLGAESVHYMHVGGGGHWVAIITMMVGLRSVLRLCRGDECAAAYHHELMRTCRTEECWRFVEERLGGMRSVVIGSSPSSAELTSRLPVRVAEVEELARAHKAMPGCTVIRGAPLEDILSSAPWIGDPGRRWKLFLVDGGLVAATWDLKFAVTICARPGCDLRLCRVELGDWLPEPLVDAILGAAADREVWGLARENPMALLGLIAARAVGGDAEA